MNKAILIGRLCKDLDIKHTTTGKTVANFTLAIDRRFKNKDGQKEADFILCQAWGKTAEILGQYTSKGSKIGVIGRIQTRNYDATDGTKRYVTEIIVDEFEFLDSKKDSIKKAPQDNALNDDDFHLMAGEDDLPF